MLKLVKGEVKKINILLSIKEPRQALKPFDDVQNATNITIKLNNENGVTVLQKNNASLTIGQPTANGISMTFEASDTANIALLNPLGDILKLYGIYESESGTHYFRFNEIEYQKVFLTEGA